MTYFHFSTPKFKAIESIQILTEVITTVWFFRSLQNCDGLGKFVANGTIRA